MRPILWLTSIEPICEVMFTIRGLAARRRCGSRPRLNNHGPTALTSTCPISCCGGLRQDVAPGLVGTEVAGVDAGVVQHHVDRLVADGVDEVGDRLLVAHVDGVDVLGDRREF